jgi:hypothetical protein
MRLSGLFCCGCDGSLGGSSQGGRFRGRTTTRRHRHDAQTRKGDFDGALFSFPQQAASATTACGIRCKHDNLTRPLSRPSTWRFPLHQLEDTSPLPGWLAQPEVSNLSWPPTSSPSASIESSYPERIQSTFTSGTWTESQAKHRPTNNTISARPTALPSTSYRSFRFIRG